MSDTTTTMQAPVSGVIEHLDPHLLVIETNVRAQPVLSDEFIDSIRSAGVLTPILAWRDSDGVVQVRAGQRRTLAAREAGLATVPVYVVDAAAGDTAARVIEQLIENEHRAELTDSERVAAWQQLAFEGLSVATIAKRTGTRREHVASGLTVAASTTTTALLGQVTLEQAAVLAEFEGSPAVLDELTAVAKEDPDYFPVAVQRARDEAATRALIREAEQVEAARGHRVLTERPGWNAAPWPVSRLRDADGNPVGAEQVTGRPGVAVLVTASPWRDDSPVQVTYYLDDPAALGFTVPEQGAFTGTGSGQQAAPMSEEQKAERRVLIARNKEWDAAQTVRRDWLARMLTRKTLPKNATAVLAATLTGAPGLVADSMSRGSEVATALLGLEPDPYGHRALAGYLDQQPTRALHVALAVILGGIEQTLTRNTWRSPTSPAAAYLNALAAWGYVLCPVERIAAMLDTLTTDPDAAHDSTSNDEETATE